LNVASKNFIKYVCKFSFISLCLLQNLKLMKKVKGNKRNKQSAASQYRGYDLKRLTRSFKERGGA